MVLEFKSTLTNKPDLLKFIVYQILENIKDPDFYSGSRIGNANSSITYSRVSQLLNAVRHYRIEGEELEDALKVAEFLLMKAISISDREIPKSQTHSEALVETKGKVMAGSDSSEISLINLQLETLQELSLIMLEYKELQTPNQNVSALLCFEADYIVKSYITTPLKELNEHSGKHIKDGLNEIPKEVIKSYVQFQLLLATI